MAEIPQIQRIYEQIQTQWPYSEQALFALGAWISHLIGYWFINGLLYIVYHFDLFPQYKIQPAQKWPPWSLVRKCLLERAFSTVALQPAFFYYLYGAFKRWSYIDVSGPVPSLTVFAWQIFVWFVLNDALFYWAHRGLHHPSIYGRIHKQHHLFKQTIGIAAEYAHPLEELIANTIPTFLPCVITGCHASVFWYYFLIRLWETVDAHSGYQFPWSPWAVVTAIQGGARPHDWHHSHGHKNGNFGMFRFWDRICGTDAAYKKWLAEKDGVKKWESAEPDDPVSPRAASTSTASEGVTKQE